MIRRITVAAAIGALVLMLVPAAFAGKPTAGGGGKPSGGGTTATLSASCNPCAVGDVANFWGSGYDGSKGTAQLYVSGMWAAVPVAADGTVSFGWYLSAPGTYDLRLYQSGNGGKTVLKSQLVITAR